MRFVGCLSMSLEEGGLEVGNLDGQPEQPVVKGQGGLTRSCSCSVEARTRRLPCMQLKSPSGHTNAHPLRRPERQLGLKGW